MLPNLSMERIMTRCGKIGGSLIGMMPASKRQQTSLIFWSLVWAFIASAYIFKGNPVKDWVQSGLFVGAITYLLWKSPRTSHVR